MSEGTCSHRIGVPQKSVKRDNYLTNVQSVAYGWVPEGFVKGMITRTFVVIPVGGSFELPPGVTLRVSPDYLKFDRALTTKLRPVLVPLQRFPFRDFTAEEFIGSGMLNCRGSGGCLSAFQGSGLTLGQMADACLYAGGNSDADRHN